MNKTNKNSIFLGLQILSFLIFGLFSLPILANAQGYDLNIYNGPAPVYQPPQVINPKPSISFISPNSADSTASPRTITITGNDFVPSSVAKINGSNRPTTFIDSSHLLIQANGNDMYRTDGGFFVTVFNGAPGGGYSEGSYFTVKSVVPPATSATDNTNYSATDMNTDYSNSQPTNTIPTDNSYSSLASNVIYGSDSFLPSGIVQWVLFAIVILLIIIFIRRILGGKQRYDETPLKHA